MKKPRSINKRIIIMVVVTSVVTQILINFEAAKSAVRRDMANLSAAIYGVEFANEAMEPLAVFVNKLRMGMDREKDRKWEPEMGTGSERGQSNPIDI